MGAPQDLDFLRLLLDVEIPDPRLCVEVGSKDATGHNREFIETELGCEYVGVDAEEGENVDRVHDIVFGGPLTDWFEGTQGGISLITCQNTLEHVTCPWQAARNMGMSLRPGGVLAMSAPMIWEEHRYPIDAWRFMPQGMEQLAKDAHLEIEVLWGPTVYGGPHEVQVGVIARKPHGGS